MMHSHSFRKLLGMSAAAASLLGAHSAAALDMQPIVSGISQVAFTSSVRLGLTVFARTSFNRLVAGGTFVVRCVDPRLGTISGQRTLSSSLQTGNSLYVTIPEVLPTTRLMPGFTSLPKGTSVSCSFDWTARAVESQYTIGAGGFGITIGGEERADGSSIPFTMTREDNDGEGCIQY